MFVRSFVFSQSGQEEGFVGAKLSELISRSSLWQRLLRSKGRFWLVEDPETIFEWSQAGAHVGFQNAGKWNSSASREIEIVFIGQDMDEVWIRRELEACLAVK